MPSRQTAFFILALNHLRLPAPVFQRFCPHAGYNSVMATFAHSELPDPAAFIRTSPGGVNALDFTQASRKWFRFGDRNVPSIPGLSAMLRTTVRTIAS